MLANYALITKSMTINQTSGWVLGDKNGLQFGWASCFVRWEGIRVMKLIFFYEKICRNSYISWTYCSETRFPYLYLSFCVSFFLSLSFSFLSLPLSIFFPLSLSFSLTSFYLFLFLFHSLPFYLTLYLSHFNPAKYPESGQMTLNRVGKLWIGSDWFGNRPWIQACEQLLTCSLKLARSKNLMRELEWERDGKKKKDKE